MSILDTDMQPLTRITPPSSFRRMTDWSSFTADPKVLQMQQSWSDILVQAYTLCDVVTKDYEAFAHKQVKGSIFFDSDVPTVSCSPLHNFRSSVQVPMANSRF